MGLRGPVGLRRAGAFAAALGAGAALLAVGPASAGAAVPAELWQRCESHFPQPFAAAGQCSIPRGIATDPAPPGHLYIADQLNRRIDEFTAWGAFVKAWGWKVDASAPEEKLQVCTSATGCQQGSSGPGAGQFASPQGVAVDSAGDVYVLDRPNHRVEKFDPEGHFLRMIGKGVDQGGGSPAHPGDLCTAEYLADGDVCGAGEEGSGPGQFGAWTVLGSYIAVDTESTPEASDDKVYVGDAGRIQRCNASLEGCAALPDPEGLLSAKKVASLAVVPSGSGAADAGRLLVAREASANALELDPATGVKACEAAVEKPTAVAADTGGDLYVVDGENPSTRALEFGPGCVRNEVPAFGEGFGGGSFPPTGIATGAACFDAGADLYVANSVQANSFVRAYGASPNPLSCPPPEVPPEIEAQYATSAGTEEAVLGAQINPHFWSGALGTTRYYVQYGTAACLEAGDWEAECVKERPPAPGAVLGGGVVDVGVASAGVFLSGLAPETEYRYRFVAEGSGAPGEPVAGAGGKPGQDGAAGAFSTFPAPEGPDTECENQALRGGASAALADCRAYEMVSPAEKGGGDVGVRLDLPGYPARLDQSAGGGDGIAYSANAAFAGAKSAPYSSQYIARRGEGGWGNESISPPQEGKTLIPEAEFFQLTNLYKAFSPDLTSAWNVTYTEPVLGEGGLADRPDIYRREGATGAYRACTTALPVEGETTGPQLEGVAGDQGEAIFRTQNRLTPEASHAVDSEGRPIYQLYECSFSAGGAAKVGLVSVLPGGAASDLPSTGGTAYRGYQFDFGRTQTLAGAISGDGERAFWTAFPGAGSLVANGGPGALYVRVNATKEQSAVGGGGCTEAEKACTYVVSGAVSGEPARFLAARPDGSLALFEVAGGPEAGNLYTFDVAKAEAGEEVQSLIAGKTLGVLGASEDLSHIYLVSEEDRDAGGPAQAGEPNLYLYRAGEGGSYAFIAKLAGGELSGEGPSPVNPRPVLHTARVSPDGQSAAFMSSDPQLAEAVAGYDNTDQASGEADAEVYGYEAAAGGGAGRLACLSCNRSGARPLGRKGAAAQIPTWETPLYAARALSGDGHRVFFESYEPLVLADTDGKADVYEWELAGTGGQGGCREASAAYIPASGGCVSLVSSGKSPADSQFIDAGEDGRDVFFTTAASLLASDPGSVDLYDARVLGGFPPGAAPAAGCEGEACQSPPPGPGHPTPASAAGAGEGNLREEASKHRKKHKHSKKHKHRHRARHKRGGGR